MENQGKRSINVYKYYVFQFFSNLAFFSPVIVLFWQANGLTLTQIMLLQSIYSIGVVILEVPTGAFADYFGKKNSLMLGAIFWSLGLFWYGISHTFWQFAIGELVAGIGASFVSGADRAYIHEILRHENRENDFKKVEGRGRGMLQIAQAIASFAGGFIAAISLGFTLIATSFATFISFFVSLSFPKVKDDLPREEKTDYFQIIKDSISLIKNHSGLLWLTLFFAFFNALVWPLIFYSQPYLKMLGVPIYFFGIIFALFNLVAALGSGFTNWFERSARGNSFLIISMVSVISLLMLSIMPSLYVIPLWSIFLTFVFMNQTIVSDQVLKIIPFDKAATVLSFQNLLRRLIYAFIGPVLGMASDNFGLTRSLTGYAIVMFILLGALLIKKDKLVH